MYHDAGQHDRFLSEWAWQIQQLWESTVHKTRIPQISLSAGRAKSGLFSFLNSLMKESYDIPFIHILFRILQSLVLVIMTKTLTCMADYTITGNFELSGSSSA